MMTGFVTSFAIHSSNSAINQFSKSQVPDALQLAGKTRSQRSNLLRSSSDMSRFLRFSFASILILATCAFSVMAQSTVTGAINGTVTNPNKEVVTGATITAKNNGTNKEATATTDDNGGFKVVNLEPGTYTVTVNGSGFAP